MEETERALSDDERQRIAEELATRDIETGTVFDNGTFRPAKKPPGLNLPTMEEIEEKEVEWLVSGYIPIKQVTTMAGNGGSGKTTCWCGVAAGLSSGKKTFLEDFIPDEFIDRKPMKILIFSAEDSPEYVLRRKLRKSGANLKNILTISLKDDRFKEIKFESDFLERLIEKHRPDLVIFDPIQAFVDPKIRMGDRNAMRQSLIPVASWGEKYGTTTLLIVHANKQSGVWGRKRIADSSDIWDISRSVLMVGETQEKGIRYISQEKSNYGALEDTVLFSIEDEIIVPKGTTLQKDRDFVLAE